MSEETRGRDATINAVAALVHKHTGLAAAASGREWGPWPAAKALAEAGWLKDPGDRAKIDQLQKSVAKAEEFFTEHDLADWVELGRIIEGSRRRTTMSDKSWTYSWTNPASFKPKLEHTVHASTLEQAQRLACEAGAAFFGVPIEAIRAEPQSARADLLCVDGTVLTYQVDFITTPLGP